MGLAKYNLGCGKINIAGWVNIDISGNADVEMDLGKFPWDIKSDSADEILASHILEHFTKKDAYLFISECYRILRDGGVLYIAVPDMDKFINCQLSGDWSPLGGYFWRDLNHLMGGDEREHDLHQRHKYMYCYESLAYMLEGANFFPSRRSKLLPFDNKEYAAISLYVTARKT